MIKNVQKNQHDIDKKQEEINDHTADDKAQEQDTEAKKQWEELENKYKRALADYQNLEKRVRDDRQQWIVTANKELISRLLPVLDTLLLAEKHTNDQGLKLSTQQFLQVLENEGARRIKAEGQVFDPTQMEAVGTAQGEDNIVIEEVRAGMTISGQVIRPAQVIVGKKTE